jgi:hypothetical protein
VRMFLVLEQSLDTLSSKRFYCLTSEVHFEINHYLYSERMSQ